MSARNTVILRFKIGIYDHDFKVFPIILLRHLNFGVLLVKQLCYKGKTPPFFNL